MTASDDMIEAIQVLKEGIITLRELIEDMPTTLPPDEGEDL